LSRNPNYISSLLGTCGLAGEDLTIGAKAQSLFGTWVLLAEQKYEGHNHSSVRGSEDHS
jgi:hypothetical protein